MHVCVHVHVCMCARVCVCLCVPTCVHAEPSPEPALGGTEEQYPLWEVLLLFVLGHTTS